MDQLRQNLEDYRRQLDWQSKERGGASSLSRAGESDFREKLRKKDLEIAEQLDKIEVCILSVIYSKSHLLLHTTYLMNSLQSPSLPICYFPSLLFLPLFSLPPPLLSLFLPPYLFALLSSPSLYNLLPYLFALSLLPSSLFPLPLPLPFPLFSLFPFPPFCVPGATECSGQSREAAS